MLPPILVFIAAKNVYYRDKRKIRGGYTVILFSAKLASKHQERLKANYPKQTFMFCDSMDQAQPYLSQAEILVTYGGDLTDQMIEGSVNLKWIMVMSAGLDRLPLRAIQEKGILVTNARGIHKVPMAEYAISMLLQVYRQAKQLYQSESSKVWEPGTHMQEISGKTMVIAGTGAIGQEVARLAKAFQMKTWGVSRSGKPVEYFDESYKTDHLNEILPHADFVVSVLPSTKETRGLFTYEHFQQLPNHAVFLNMGRGDVVRGGDLLKAIQEKEIAHAVLDVFKEEPLPADHAFWQEENVTVTPHLSGHSAHYMRRALEIFELNMQVYLADGKDYVNKIDPSRGY